jgi:hypothetical protein
MKRATPFVVGLATVALVVAPSFPATAHEHRAVGDHELTVGWLNEPAIAGFQNAVQFIAAHQDGEPVEEAKLQVEVIFGAEDGAERTEPMPLEPAFGSPGEYRAVLIPSRPGTYTFHVFGTLEAGEEIDESFTSGEETFAEVEDPTALQFPAQDPPAGQLAERIDRVDARLGSVGDAATAAARSARDAANTARILGIVGLALAAAALALAVVVLLAARRRTGTS